MPEATPQAYPGNQRVTAHVTSGSQDLRDGGWTYSLRLKMSYHELDNRTTKMCRASV